MLCFYSFFMMLPIFSFKVKWEQGQQFDSQRSCYILWIKMLHMCPIADSSGLKAASSVFGLFYFIYCIRPHCCKVQNCLFIALDLIWYEMQPVRGTDMDMTDMESEYNWNGKSDKKLSTKHQSSEQNQTLSKYFALMLDDLTGWAGTGWARGVPRAWKVLAK